MAAKGTAGVASTSLLAGSAGVKRIYMKTGVGPKGKESGSVATGSEARGDSSGDDISYSREALTDMQLSELRGICRGKRLGFAGPQGELIERFFFAQSDPMATDVPGMHLLTPVRRTSIEGTP